MWFACKLMSRKRQRSEIVNTMVFGIERLLLALQKNGKFFKWLWSPVQTEIHDCLKKKGSQSVTGRAKQGRRRELNSFSCCLLSSSLNFLLSRTKKKFDRRRRGNRNCRPEVEASTDPDIWSCIKDDIEPINRSGPELESFWGATWSSCDPDVVMKELSDFNWRRRFSVLIPFDSKYEKKLQPCHSQQQQLWKTHVTNRVKVW